VLAMTLSLSVLATGSCCPHLRLLMPTSYPAETLLIEGPDAMAFAHAQFSSNVSTLATGQWQFSAWLDPQGRVRALFHLARLADDRYLVLLRGGSAAPLVEALQRFVFRSKLSVTALPSRALATGPTMPLHAISDDAGILSLGCDTHSLKITAADIGDDAWRLPQLRAGWSWLPTQTLNKLLPAALSLQRLQAVAIDKGCYPGQEIVARLHYRGGHKRHLHSVTLSQVANAGDVLCHGDRDVGCVLDVLTTHDSIAALVVLTDDVAAHAHDGHLEPFNDGLMIHLDTSWPA
jgi:folate-binding protein YgfZ